MPAEIIVQNAPAVMPRATHGSPDHPLRIGEDIKIPCYVLEDGTRVLALTGMLQSLNMSKGGKIGPKTGDRLARFAGSKSINPFISSELISRITDPIKFRTPQGAVANGYNATLLPELCKAILKARAAGMLMKQQKHIAERAEALIYGLATVGVIGLVDEATGYQEARDRDALHKLLSVYLANERLSWAKQFPDDFYFHLFRLRGWAWPIVRGRTNRMVGHLTNKLVYDKMPPGVLEELKRRNPPSEDTKRRKWRHHQFLSPDFGQPDLRNHLLQLIPIMRISSDWETFERHFAVAFATVSTPAEVLEGVEYKKA